MDYHESAQSVCTKALFVDSLDESLRDNEPSNDKKKLFVGKLRQNEEMTKANRQKLRAKIASERRQDIYRPVEDRKYGAKSGSLGGTEVEVGMLLSVFNVINYAI